jgi:hypothetical protein
LDERYNQFRDFFSQNLSFQEKKNIWLQVNDMSEEELDAMLAANRERLDRVPKVGEQAPDFELERLGANKKATGEMVRLSELRGRPVALVFGAYT